MVLASIAIPWQLLNAAIEFWVTNPPEISTFLAPEKTSIPVQPLLITRGAIKLIPSPFSMRKPRAFKEL